METLNNYITERIRINNIKRMDFTQPTLIEGVGTFEIHGRNVQNDSGFGVSNKKIYGTSMYEEWYYCEYDNKLIFFSPNSQCMPFIEKDNVNNWLFTWAPGNLTEKNFKEVMDQTAKRTFNEYNIMDLDKITISPDTQRIIDNWESTF